MSMQYIGWCSVDGVMVPITRSGVAAHPAPVLSEDTVQGGTPGGAVSPINYAQGNVTYNGDIAFHMHTGTIGAKILDKAITTRDAYFPLIIDDALDQFNYNAKVKQLALSARVGGSLDATMTVEAITRTRAAHGTAPGAFTATTTGNLNTTPIPFWNTQFLAQTAGGSITGRMVTAWDVTINNNTFTLQTASGSREPTDIQQGLLTVSGSFTYYPVAANPVTTPASDPFTQAPSPYVALNPRIPGDVPDPTPVTITLGATVLNIPNILFREYNRDITGPNQKPMRVCSFVGLGSLSQGACFVS